MAAGCIAPPSGGSSVLLFDGRGASPADVAAIEDILRQGGVRYATVSSSQLDAMSERTLQGYQLLLFPGGDFELMGRNLKASTAIRLRGAVGHGVGYLGICAGAFFAGASPYNGLNLTHGVSFPFYELESRGIRKAAISVSTAAGSTVEVYWEDGPDLRGWGAPVARYPAGSPAVVEGKFGDGWVVLTGVHPEAPESWRRQLAFTRPASESRAYAATIISAALNHRSLDR